MSGAVDPIALAVFQNAMTSIAEEMGAALRRSSISPNIKERRDYSCAIFDGEGRVIAMGDHMPVHLGSMGESGAGAATHVPALDSLDSLNQQLIAAQTDRIAKEAIYRLTRSQDPEVVASIAASAGSA